MKASKDFFSLPQEAKDETLKIPPVEQGYVKPGQEIFDAKEDWKKVHKWKYKKYRFFGRGGKTEFLNLTCIVKLSL